MESDSLHAAPPAAWLTRPLSRRNLFAGTAALAAAFAVRGLRIAPVAAQQAPAQTATVNSSDGLHLRSGPGASYDSLAIMPAGAVVTVTGPATPDNWLPVQYNGQSGWADGTYLTLNSAPQSGTGSDPSAGSATPQGASASASVAAQPSTATVVPPDGLNLRAGPSTSNQVVTVIPGGSTVTVTGASANGWTPVSFGGSSGWVESAYLSGGIFATTANGSTVVAAGSAASGAASLAPMVSGAAATANTAAYGTAAMGIAGPPERYLTATAAPQGTLGRFIWPVDTREITTLFQPAHQAIDDAHPVGKQVQAMADGIVSFAGGDPSVSYGLYVIIQHPGGFSSLYAHLGSLNVKQGDTVKQGDALGPVGMTGRTTGPHLHFALYYQGEPLNPLTVLPVDGVQVLPGANDVA